MSVEEFRQQADARGYRLSETEAVALYEQLKHSARRQRKFNVGDETLRTTVLVNELWLKLFNGSKTRTFKSQGHFLACAALGLRHIVIDKLRARRRQGGLVDDHVVVDEQPGQADEALLLNVHELLDRLSEHNPRAAQVVEGRFFAGYTEPEIAEMLDISERTVRRDWVTAQDWLAERLDTSPDRS